MVEQWRHPRMVAAMLDFAHKDDVVPFHVAASVKTLETGDATGNQRGTTLPLGKSQVFKAVLVTAGKAQTPAPAGRPPEC
jgi:hypothetical protein